MLAHLLLTFRHRAGVRPYTSSIDFAESCVFDKQSPPPGLCHPLLVAQKRVPLLPKLRGQFAEFLQHHSLIHLRMLYESTCVGFGYGLKCQGYFLEVLRCLQNPIITNNLRPSSPLTGQGILTLFPSTTTFVLALGADSPCADYPCAGTLRFSVGMVLTCLIVTYVSILTSDTSSKPRDLPSTAYRTLRYRILRCPRLRYTV